MDKEILSSLMYKEHTMAFLSSLLLRLPSLNPVESQELAISLDVSSKYKRNFLHIENLQRKQEGTYYQLYFLRGCIQRHDGET